MTSRNTGVTATVLAYLNSHPGHINIHDVAAALGVTSRVTSDALSRQVRLGNPGLTRTGRASYEYHRKRVTPPSAGNGPPVGIVERETALFEQVGRSGAGRLLVKSDETGIVYELVQL